MLLVPEGAAAIAYAASQKDEPLLPPLKLMKSGPIPSWQSVSVWKVPKQVTDVSDADTIRRPSV
jgi:hypothetical protein